MKSLSKESKWIIESEQRENRGEAKGAKRRSKYMG